MKVKFWPKGMGITTRICNHRYDAVMTFSHQTDDRYQNSIFAAEEYGFKNNFCLGAFVNNITGNYSVGISEAEASGLMRHDIYYPTEYWKNPITGVIQVIPDWGVTTWTSAGAAVFPVTAGTTKANRYPNHGQQMYDLSAGAYGYDVINSVSGTSNLSEYVGVITYVQNWLKSLTGRSVSGGSYRLGITNMFPLQAPRWLGVRNSVPSPSVNGVTGNTFYGNSKISGKLGIPTSSIFSRQTWNTYPSTSRWWDMWNNDGFTKAQATTYIQAQIALTLANGGWYRDFCHWHAAKAAVSGIASLDEFLSVVRSAVGSNFIHTCSNGEALEYMYLRELSHRATAYELNGDVHIVVDMYDQFKSTSTSGILNDVPLDKINTPLTISIDLSASSLAGKFISLNYGKAISLGSDQYLIEVPLLSKEEGFMSIRIKEVVSANYRTLARPTGSFSITGGVLSGTTNMLCKIVLFSVATGGAEYDSLPFYRSLQYATSHSVVVPAGNDYRVGIISESGQANLVVV